MSWHQDISISVLTRCCVIHRKNTRLLKLPQSPCGESQLLFYWNWVSCFPQLFFLCQQGMSAFVLLIPVQASVELRKASEKFPAVFAALHAAVCPPPPRLCSILWVSFVFLILLRGFSAVSHGEWTRPGLKTLSWRCFFWFFLDNALCVFHWSWCTLCTITVAGPELCYWDPFKLCGRHYPITDGSILSSRH